MTGTDPITPANRDHATTSPGGPQAGRGSSKTAPLPILSASTVAGTAAPVTDETEADRSGPSAHDRPGRIRWSVAALAVAGLMVAGGVGGVVAESVGSSSTTAAASSPATAGGTDQGTSAQTVADPATLAETLDHIHDGISIPAADGTEGAGGTQVEAGNTQVEAGVELDDADGILEVNTASTLGEGAGTGMVLSADGLALTNYHVVDGSSEVEVTVSDSGETYTATVVGRDATHDVAVLQLQGASDLVTISIDASGVDAGDKVAAVGNGSGQGYLTAVSGRVTAVDQSISAESLGDTEDLTGLIETDADVVPGYSGGPLVDADGQIVGMSTAASAGETSEQVNGYAIEISAALDIADQIMAGTESDTVQVGASGSLGVTVTDAPAASRPEYAAPRGPRNGWSGADGATGPAPDGGSGAASQSGAAGALIVEVSPGSAAETVGLVAGDIVTALDETGVTDSSALADLVQSLDPGDTVTLEWTDADGAEHHATVELGESTVN